MLRIFLLSLGILTCSTSMGQMNLEAKPESQADRRQHPLKATLPLNSQERALVFKAAAGNASSSELKMALDVCTKKCKPCHDGVRCNLECAKKCAESE
jgi:hypothetical protein